MFAVCSTAQLLVCTLQDLMYENEQLKARLKKYEEAANTESNDVVEDVPNLVPTWSHHSLSLKDDNNFSDHDVLT